MSTESILCGLSFRSGRWESIGTACSAVRNAVFVAEQGVPVALENDGKDELCLHVLAVNRDGLPIGTGRLLPDGHIGRVAVLKQWRGGGVGEAIVALLIEEARALGHKSVALNAQVSAIAFYRRFGFEAIGDCFIEAGLQHQSMRLNTGE